MTNLSWHPTHPQALSAYTGRPIFQNKTTYSVECQESVLKVIIFKSADMLVGRVGGRFQRDSEGGLTNKKQATSVQQSGLSVEGWVGGEYDIVSGKSS